MKVCLNKIYRLSLYQTPDGLWQANTQTYEQFKRGVYSCGVHKDPEEAIKAALHQFDDEDDLLT